MISRRPSIPALIAALVLVASPLAAHPVERDALASVDTSRVQREILAFRTGLVEAIRAKDVARLRDMYVADFTQTHASGRTDGRDARIVQLLAGDPVIETVTPDDLAIRVYGPDTAVATGRSTIPNKDGTSYDVKWLAIYTKASGEWRLASSQATRAPGSS